MGNRNILVAGCLILYASFPAHELQPEFKAIGHSLGETAEQFYSEGYIGDVLRACDAGDLKSVSRLFKNVENLSKNNPKGICKTEILARLQATSGARFEYKGTGDKEAMRADAFTFDGGQLVKIDIAYSAPIAYFPLEGQHPKYYGELLVGLEEDYGPPTKTYTKPVLNSYGVEHAAHAAMWLRNKDVITIFQQLGLDAWTRIVGETLAEYNREAQVPQPVNPLQ